MAFSGSSVISKTVAAVTGRLGTLVGVWAAFFAIQILLFVVFGGLVGGAAFAGLGGDGNVTGLSVGLIVGIFLLYLIYLLIGAAQTAALSAAASPLMRPSAGESVSIGFRSAPTMIGVILLLLVAYFAGAIAFAIVAAILGAISESLAFVALVLFVPLLVWAACRVSIVFPVIAVDGVTGPVAAVKRAWSLTEGHVLKIIAIFVIFAIAASIIFGVILALFGGSIASMATLGEMPSMGMLAGAGILFLIASILLTIIAAALMAAIHGELAGTGGDSLAETFG